MKQHLPIWTHEWLGVALPLLRITLIVLAAWLLRTLAVRLIRRITARYPDLPAEVALSARKLATFLISAAALLLVLETMGVSGAVLWTAFTGFAAVAAIAFFAAWSVLSNIFCTLLIFTTRPFRLGDMIEIVENGEKPGFRGRVIDVNLIYSTLEEAGGAHGGGNYVQIPNSLFFQRALRRWRPGSEPQAAPAPAADSSSTPAAASPGGGSAAPVAANDP